MTFVIENLTDSDIWIDPLYLTFYFEVYSVNGNKISRKTSRHLDALESDFRKVEKKSNKELEWNTDFFDNFQFELNEEYYLKCGYEPPILRGKDKRVLKTQNIELLENRFEGKSNMFRICKI